MRAGPVWHAGDLAGRDAELDALGGVLDALAQESAVVLVVGDPGMGKSAVWTATMERAAAEDVAVLVARPAQSEHASPWSGVADLLGAVHPAVLDTLAPPLRNAVEAVCLREAPTGEHIDERAVWTALRAVVVALTADRPLLIAIDDVHWLDTASARALASLCRRLPARGAGVIATTRPVDEGPARDLLDVPASTRIDLTPLGRHATAAAVRRHLQVVLSGPALERVHAAAGGNPMFAIELARSGAHRAGRPPAVPRSLRDLVVHRVEATSADARVTIAALAAAPVSDAQLAAAGLDRGLAEAIRADLVEVGATGPAPSHPLFGAAAYESCDVDTRRRIHTRLAAVVSGEQQRARHAALGTAAAEASTLAALDAAAGAAAVRGAPDAAAELMMLALDLTPSADELRWARHLAAGEYHFRAGDSAAARDHFERVLASGDSALRARAAIRLAELAWETETAEVAAGRAADAVEISEGLPAAQAEAEIVRARVLAAVDLEHSAVAAQHALGLLDALGDDADIELLAAALVAGATADFRIGRVRIACVNLTGPTQPQVFAQSLDVVAVGR